MLAPPPAFICTPPRTASSIVLAFIRCGSRQKLLPQVLALRDESTHLRARCRVPTPVAEQRHMGLSEDTSVLQIRVVYEGPASRCSNDVANTHA